MVFAAAWTSAILAAVAAPVLAQSPQPWTPSACCAAGYHVGYPPVDADVFLQQATSGYIDNGATFRCDYYGERKRGDQVWLVKTANCDYDTNGYLVDSRPNSINCLRLRCQPECDLRTNVKDALCGCKPICPLGESYNNKCLCGSNCPEGFQWFSLQKICRPICQEGYEYGPDLVTCQPKCDPETTEVICEDGTVLTNTCTCERCIPKEQDCGNARFLKGFCSAADTASEALFKGIENGDASGAAAAICTPNNILAMQIAAVQALAIPIAGEFIAAGLESVVAVCTVKLVGKIGVKAGLKGVKQACSASASTLESSIQEYCFCKGRPGSKRTTSSLPSQTLIENATRTKRQTENLCSNLMSTLPLDIDCSAGGSGIADIQSSCAALPSGLESIPGSGDGLLAAINEACAVQADEFADYVALSNAICNLKATLQANKDNCLVDANPQGPSANADARKRRALRVKVTRDHSDAW